MKSRKNETKKTDFYVICGDCGGLGKVVVLGVDDDNGVDIIY